MIPLNAVSSPSQSRCHKSVTCSSRAPGGRDPFCCLTPMLSPQPVLSVRPPEHNCTLLGSSSHLPEDHRASKQSPAFPSCAETRVMVKNRSHQTSMVSRLLCYDSAFPVTLPHAHREQPCRPRVPASSLYFHLFSPGLGSNIVSEGPLTIPVS